MVIRGRAPLRVSFGGGGTDVEPFCVEQGGAIIGSTINKYAYCSIIPRDDDQITVHSLDFDMTVKYNAKENYVCDGRLDLVTAALRAMDIKQGCEVYLQCDAPAGSGLGTSSTVMVSLLTAMARWKGITLDNYAMADLAYGVERIDLGISGGYQDQYAATFGGFNFIEFHGRNNVVVNPLRIRRGYRGWHRSDDRARLRSPDRGWHDPLSESWKKHIQNHRPGAGNTEWLCIFGVRMQDL